MFNRFIEQPVLSGVISILIVLLGILGLVNLPVSQYPDIAPPTIVVSSSYQGASAEVVLNSVIVPLEEQINGVENMAYIRSSAGNDGSARITIVFKTGTDPDMAAVNVQNRVASATSRLPQEVTRAGISTFKTQSSTLIIFALTSDNPDYDDIFLQNYAEINIIPQIKRVTGVGEARAYGQKDYAMRIWLKPDVMANYGLIPSDIHAALAEQNMEAAPGQFGAEGKQSFQYVIKYKGRLADAQEFENIIVRTTSDGQFLRLKDIAEIELGARGYGGSTTTDGKISADYSISQTAGSNAQEVIKECMAILDEAKKSFPPGVDYVTTVNANDFLEASVQKVVTTLIEAFVLVFLIVFIFLQDFRSTLIPAIAVPVSIIGTFFFLYLFGFTINLLTLFALLLAIGIVVDDAIVVVEAVHTKLEEGYTSSMKASKDAMKEITGAIISITLVMAAVFLPVSFISGSAGVFYKQFGLTLAVAILISAVNALTLSPALCALFLKPHTAASKKNNLLQRFFTAFNTGFTTTTQKYRDSVSFLVKRKWIAVGAVVVFTGIFCYFSITTPSSFVPNEDTGSIFADVALPISSSIERTEEVIAEVERLALTIPEVETILRTPGRGMISGSGTNYGMVIVKLKPWAERTGKGQDIQSIIGQLFEKTSSIREARIIFFAPPTIRGFGSSDGFEFQLQDRSGQEINTFSQVGNDFLAELNKRPEIRYASTSFDPSFPQYEIEVNLEKVKEAGFSLNDILQTMQGYYGGVYASNFNQFGKEYRVMYQSDAHYRANPDGLSHIYVRNVEGVMAPITSFIEIKRVYGPQSISRFNLYTSIGVNGAPNPGYSSGDAIKAINEVAAQNLPIGYGIEYSGLTKEEISAGSQTLFIFILVIAFVFLLLSAQYGSFIIPFAVLLSLPVGLAGTYIFAFAFGIENSIYIQITLIMLVGLLSKNAILIVEFALERRRQGMSLVQAALNGAQVRLRPILMTSFAFIFGLIPLMLATGAGAVGNRAVGTGAIGGMLIGTVLGVFIIPIMFIIFQSMQEKLFPKTQDEGASSGGIKLNILVPLIGSVLLSACGVTNRSYVKPEVETDGLYRDVLPQDTTHLAQMNWTEIYVDPLLQKLIQTGLDHNLNLEMAYLNIDKAQAYFAQSKAAFLPSADVTAGLETSHVARSQREDRGSRSTQYRASLSVAWEADIWGKLKSSKQAELAQLLATNEAARVVKTQLVASIAHYYFQLLALDAQLNITERTVENWLATVETMRALKEATIVTEAAVVQSEAQLYAAEVTIPDLKQAIREAENTLSILVGQKPGPIERGRMEEQVLPKTMNTGVPAEILSRRPDVLMAELEFRKQYELSNVARSYFYPSVSITGTAGSSTRHFDDFFKASSFFANIGAGIFQPILNKRMNKTRLEVALIEQETALLNFKSALLEAGKEVTDALSLYETAGEKLNIRAKQKDALEKAVSYTQELLENGFANYTEVITARQSHLQAELGSVNDRMERLLAIVDLYRSLGGG